MKLTFLSNPSELKQIRLKIVAYCKDTLPDLDTSKVIIAVDEALQNIIRYAYKMDKTKKIIITIDKISDESLKVKIRDYGIQAPIESIKPRDLEDIKPGGLGVHFIKNSTKKMDYEHQADGGTLLTLIF